MAHEGKFGKIGRGNGTEFFWEERGLGRLTYVCESPLISGAVARGVEQSGEDRNVGEL